MPTQKLLCDLDVGGEVKGTSLDINGNADIAGNLVIQGGGPSLTIKDTTDDDDQQILFVSSSGAVDYRIHTADFTGAGGGDGLYIGSTQSDGEVCLVTHDTIALTLDTSQNATFAGSITGTSGTFSGNINANGNIVGDDGTQITNIDSIGADSYTADADSTTRITMGATSIDCLVADTDIFQIGENFFTFDGAVDTTIKKRKFSKTTNTDANADGDIVYFGGTTSMDAGKIYYYTGAEWALADADAAANAKGMLGVALGSASDTNGVLIRGMVTLDHDPGTIGDTLFLSTTQGTATATAPSGTGDIVRVVGYCLDSSNGQIYFNPDGTFVEIA